MTWAVTMTNTEAPDDTPIWRYMDLPKFVAILASKTLWFGKAARLEDQYEGYCQVLPRKMPPNDPFAPCINVATADGETTPISATQLAVMICEWTAERFKNAREHLYVNSWCLADESMAMWQIYGSEGRGIALRSSVGQYRSACKFRVQESQYAFGKVTYDNDPESNPRLRRDFREGSIPLPGPGLCKELLPVAFHKRKCYEYEREWRAALYQDLRPECPGCEIEFDLNKLISAVYVGPRADDFLFGVVNSVMEKFESKKPLERSRLLQPPNRITAVT